MGKQAVWMALSACLFALCAWNIVANRRLKEAVAYLTGGEGLGSDAHPFKKAVLGSQEMAFGHVGRVLAWPQGLTPLGGEEPLRPTAGQRLILAIDEMACDACRDQETQFVLDVADMAGNQAVTIVVHARHSRYVRAYIRVNGIAIPVYFDPEARFFKANAITESPLMLLVNERDEVLAAHYPVTDEPDLCLPFHKMCFRVFGVSHEVEANRTTSGVGRERE